MAPRSAPPLGPRKHVRRSLIVSPGFQLRALLPLLTFLLLAAALLAAGLFYPLQQRAAHEPDLRVRTLLHEQLVQVHERLWPLLLAAGLGASYLVLRHSGRVAGALYHLHLYLNQLAEGDYQPLRLRKKDEFRFFEDDAAKLAQKMKLLATRNRNLFLSLQGGLRHLAGRLEKGEEIPRAELEELVTTMQEQVAKALDTAPARR